MRCILAEKPSVAMDIARTLGTPVKHQGYVTVGSDTITWAYGHLVTLADPEQYDPTWKSWAWATLPLLPDPFQLCPIPKTAAHLSLVLRLLRQADRIVMATDGDREGELIGRYIYQLAQVQTPVDRLWLSENTPTAIRKALASMQPASAYDALGRAAQARAQADWIVGLNATRAFSLRHGRPGHPLSVGRVQTPTLKLIVDRDHAIAQFQPTPYWEVTATFQAAVGTYSGVWQGPESAHPTWLPTAAAAQALVDRLPPGTAGRIARVETQRVTLQPPLFFNLNDLQKAANRRMGLTAQQTLDSAQRLYDAHLISYPRTEARVITTDVAPSLAQRIQGLRVSSPALRTRIVQDLPHRVGRVIHNAAVAKAGHYAIIPTGHGVQSPLSATDQAVYTLICHRFLAALLPPGLDDRTTVWTVVAEDRFKTTGSVLVRLGWREVLTPDPPADPGDSPDTPTESPLPVGLQAQDPVHVTQAQSTAKHTKPPAHYTDATLLTVMEKHGLGTPATRARIFEVLLTREYVQRRKKTLVSTATGQQLLAVLPPIVQSPDLTGAWETRLDAIAAGQETPQAFLAGIRQLAHDLVADAQQQAAPPAPTVQGLGPCPVCHQGTILESSKAWGCSRWRDGCPFTIWKTIAGKTLSIAQVRRLLAGRPTAVIRGFQRKTGTRFDAQLRWDATTGRVQFVFPPHPARTAQASLGE